MILDEERDHSHGCLIVVGYYNFMPFECLVDNFFYHWLEMGQISSSSNLVKLARALGEAATWLHNILDATVYQHFTIIII